MLRLHSYDAFSKTEHNFGIKSYGHSLFLVIYTTIHEIPEGNLFLQHQEKVDPIFVSDFSLPACNDFSLIYLRLVYFFYRNFRNSSTEDKEPLLSFISFHPPCPCP